MVERLNSLVPFASRLQSLVLSSLTQLGGRELSLNAYECLFWYFPPRKISPLKEKNKCLPRPWAAPLSQLCAAINESDQYNTTSPSPGRGSPGPGVSAGPIDSQLGQAPAASRSGPTPPATNYTQPRRRPFILPRPCAGDLEQRVSRPPEGSRPSSARASLANAPSWPPTKH